MGLPCKSHKRMVPSSDAEARELSIRAIGDGGNCAIVLQEGLLTKLDMLAVGIAKNSPFLGKPRLGSRLLDGRLPGWPWA